MEEGNRFGWITEPINIAMAFFTIVILLVILSKINTKAQASATWTQPAKDVMSGALSKLTSAYNYGIIIVIVFAIVAMIIYTKSQNLGTFEKIGVCFIFIFIVVLLTIPANIYDQAKAKSSDINVMGNQLTFIDYILSHLLEFGLVMIGIVVYFIFTLDSDQQPT